MLLPSPIGQNTKGSRGSSSSKPHDLFLTEKEKIANPFNGTSEFDRVLFITFKHRLSQLLLWDFKRGRVVIMAHTTVLASRKFSFLATLKTKMLG